MTATSKFEQHEFGSSWTQIESMGRCSHALVHDGRVWLVDPVDSEGDVDRAIGDNEPAGVIQLLDRHDRDSAALAERLSVPHLNLPTAVPESPFTTFSVIDRRIWREVGLWWAERKVLVVAEAIMTTAALAIAGTGIGVHPGLRLIPPGALRPYTEVHHLLPGHGEPLHAPDLGERIQTALDKSRSDLPRTIARIPRLIKDARG
ncbi:MAG: hypothetical protein HYX29_01370 [Solirubrobacterales bacterium]|nr:hypothetical protein [Solirubrobacterales bacterium]